MEIQKPGMGTYDAQYIPVVRSDRPVSIKPNVLRDLEDPVARAFLLTDGVTLSPEAKKLLKQVAGGDLPGEGSLPEEHWLELYEALKTFAAAHGKTTPRHLTGRGSAPDLVTLRQQPVVGEERSRKSRQEGQALSGVEELLDRMIVAAPSDSVRRTLVRELAVFGDEVVRTCKKFGIRIVILPRGRQLGEVRVGGTFLVGVGERTFDGRPWGSVRGIYDQSRRLVVVGEELVGLPGDVPSRHEFAHAYDHMYSSKFDRKLPLSVQLWNLFAPNREATISEYAATQPAEYFAESVEAFFNPRKRETLVRYDPRMVQFLTQLFAA